MNIENFTVEEICERINIQANLIDLQSKNKKKIYSAITTLTTITNLTKRRDALYALCGYYLLEVEDIDEIEFFFDAIRNLNSIELLKLILKDISEDKYIYRSKLFIDNFLRKLSIAIIKANAKDKNEIKLLIEDSAWGEKLKKKFLCQIETEKF